MDLTDADPKGLIRESYNIEAISDGECRSILIDWALSLRAGVDQTEALRVLLVRYGPGAEAHPMTVLLTAALTPGAAPQRRGGRAARLGLAP
ncbi:MAG: hypothetical protein Q8K20_14200 [Gemmobacter sp.]|nr:hypothetical protein [Gemmobacter sp.]